MLPNEIHFHTYIDSTVAHAVNRQTLAKCDYNIQPLHMTQGLTSLIAFLISEHSSSGWLPSRLSWGGGGGGGRVWTTHNNVMHE